MSDETTYEVSIERFADQGRCVAHIDGRVVFVRFALPGERVRIVLDEPHEREDRFWTGEVTEVLEASDDRVEPVWPLAGPLAWGGGLGGADLVHASLDAGLRWKKAVIDGQMSRLAGLDTDVRVEQMAGDAARQGLGWRTRIELIADEAGYASMSLRGSHTRRRLDAMPLATSALSAVAQAQGVWAGGFEPGAKIRLAVPEPPAVKTAEDTGAEGSAAALPDINTISFALSVNSELRAGSAQLRETVLGAGRASKNRRGAYLDQAYTLDSSAFWQVHRAAPSTLVAAVRSQVERWYSDTLGSVPKVVWDLYSGSGLFTLALGNYIGREGKGLVSIEGSALAVQSARANLEAAGLSHAVAKLGDVSRTLRSLPLRFAHPDLVVLDPPRSGAKRAVCTQIARVKPRLIVYVACDPTSLARDAKTLGEQGYQLADIHAYDIYPLTHHVETVAVFRRSRG